MRSFPRSMHTAVEEKYAPHRDLRAEWEHYFGQQGLNVCKQESRDEDDHEQVHGGEGMMEIKLNEKDTVGAEKFAAANEARVQKDDQRACSSHWRASSMSNSTRERPPDVLKSSRLRAESGEWERRGS